MASPNRKENYKALRSVGYSYIEATRYKDLSSKRISALLDAKRFKVGDIVTTPMIDGLEGKVIKVYPGVIKVKFLSGKTNIDLKAGIDQFKKVGG